MCVTRLLCVIMYKNGREKMWQFILGSAGFLLYYIYDINCIEIGLTSVFFLNKSRYKTAIHQNCGESNEDYHYSDKPIVCRRQ